MLLTLNTSKHIYPQQIWNLFLRDRERRKQNIYDSKYLYAHQGIQE